MLDSLLQEVPVASCSLFPEIKAPEAVIAEIAAAGPANSSASLVLQQHQPQISTLAKTVSSVPVYSYLYPPVYFFLYPSVYFYLSTPISTDLFTLLVNPLPW